MGGGSFQCVTRWRSDTTRLGWYIDALSSIQLDHVGIDDDDAADLRFWQPLPEPPECG